MHDEKTDFRKEPGRPENHAGIDMETFKAGLGKTSDSACRHILVTGNGEELCRVTRFMGGKILFVEERTEMDCRHLVAFGHSSICTCPVRKKLFQLHGV